MNGQNDAERGRHAARLVTFQFLRWLIKMVAQANFDKPVLSWETLSFFHDFFFKLISRDISRAIILIQDKKFILQFIIIYDF